MLLQALAIAGSIYIAVLIFLSYRARTKDRDSKAYFMAGSNLGAFLGFFTLRPHYLVHLLCWGCPTSFETMA